MSNLLLVCLFNAGVQASLPPLEPSIESTGTEKLEISFLVDTAEKTATLMGNAGAVSVDVKLKKHLGGNETISFLQSNEGLGVTVTTIDISEGGELAAVHSRHTLIIDGLTPAQWYGSCLTK